jgi:E3 Ubiquitin ligase
MQRRFVLVFTYLILSVLVVVFWALGGVMLYLRRQSRRKLALMSRVQTTEASPAYRVPAGTAVEVRGTLRCENPLTSEMAERSCAYYRSEIARVYVMQDSDPGPGGQSNTTTHREVVASETRFAPFSVEDESGAVGVRLEGAEVDAERVVERFEPHEGREGPMVSFAGQTIRLGGGRNTVGYEYTESILPLDRPVYVLGVAQEDGQIGADAVPVDDPPRPLSLGEGGEVGYLPSRADAERRFIVSHRSEEALAQAFGKSAFWTGLGAIGAFLLGAVLLAVIGLLVAMS